MVKLLVLDECKECPKVNDHVHLYVIGKSTYYIWYVPILKKEYCYNVDSVYINGLISLWSYKMIVDVSPLAKFYKYYSLQKLCMDLNINELETIVKGL